MRLALIQFNPTVGDPAGNADRIADWVERARGDGADLVVFPELALSGYPPRDLLLQHGFLPAVQRSAAKLAERTAGLTVLVGAPWPMPSGAPINAALVLHGGSVGPVYAKRLLPTYDVFDEDRYFTPGDRPLVINAAGVRVGIAICEDLWKGDDAGVAGRYARDADPADDLIKEGARVIVSLSASPFVLGKGARQRAILTRHVERARVALAAVNQVGGNDDLIFDGHSAVYAPGADGVARLIAAGPGFEEAMVLADLDLASWSSAPIVDDPLQNTPDDELLFRALVLGVRDYCRKTGFTSAVLGLSGGIDSAVTAALASAALGPERVLGVLMPSRYSSAGSVSDAEDLARRLGLRHVEVPVEPAHGAMENLLGTAFAQAGLEGPAGVTEENLQSRLRGTILMAFSNRSGSILLTTGNKSELAVGYCTLYGDMNGGLAVLADVTKAQVYRLARWMNAHWARAGFNQPPIPEATISKPPSAELRPNQTDQDTLPPYDILDAVLERFIERHESPAEIAAATGIDERLAARLVRMIDLAEYKRKQMPVGLKVSSLAFGPGRRRPIAHGWKSA